MSGSHERYFSWIYLSVSHTYIACIGPNDTSMTKKIHQTLGPSQTCTLHRREVAKVSRPTSERSQSFFLKRNCLSTATIDASDLIIHNSTSEKEKAEY